MLGTIMRNVTRRLLSAVVFVGLVSVSVAVSAETGPIKPSPTDKCPVCGMFVAKYPDWTAEIIFTKGSVVFFDGAKDLFKYYFDLKTYDPKKTRGDIAAVYVTEYYDMKPVDAHTAFFVIGSDVYGPMGRELIPFTTSADAEVFLKDHKGRRILRFEQISPAIIRKLD